MNTHTPSVLWFYGVRAKRTTTSNPTLTLTATSSPSAQTWNPFSKFDSQRMESVYQQSLSTTSTSGFPPLVQVLEDCLFEVNLDARELYPLYWEGSVLEIRRGLWFRPALSSDKSSSSSASGFVPCDDNLSQQAENGYNKHKPWMTTGSGAGNHVLTSLSSATSLSSTSNSSLVATVDQEPHGKISSDIDAAAAAVFASIALPPDYTIPQSSSSATNSTSSTSELRWALFGPYMNQFIVYTNKSTAFLFSDQLSSKFTRAVYTKLTKGEHLGGVKLVRGWDEVERLKQQQQQQQAADANASKKSTSSSKSATTTPNTSPSRDNGGKDPASLSTPPQDHSSPTAAATDTFEQESLANFLDQGGNNNTSMDSSSTTTSAASNKAEIDLQQPRKINHLVFVIHGIGQKLGERVDSINFVNDCATLRRSFKHIAKTASSSSISNTSEIIPLDSGVQVLPIQWRQKLQFGEEHAVSSTNTKSSSTSAADLLNSPVSPSSSFSTTGRESASFDLGSRDGGVAAGGGGGGGDLSASNVAATAAAITTSSSSSIPSSSSLGQQHQSPTYPPPFASKKPTSQAHHPTTQLPPPTPPTTSTSSSIINETTTANIIPSLSDITLDGVASIRALVSDVILDVLLYMTPKYRQAMLSHVTDEMNRIYRLYRAKNPGFSGRVSLYGHSLGSLLAFDILAHQKAASVGGGTASKSSSSRRNSASQKSRFVAGGIDLGDMLKGAPVTGEKKVVGGSLGDANIEYKSLYFEVDKFFAVGSPLGLFLLLKGDILRSRCDEIVVASSRGNSPIDLTTDTSSSHSSNNNTSTTTTPPAASSSSFVRPKVNAIYNIFHPYDPVAYRLEPIVNKAVATAKPEYMPYTKGGLLKGALVGIPNIYNAMVGRSITMLESMKFGLGGGGGSKSTTSSASSMNAEKAVAASPAPSAAYKDLLAQIGDAEVCRHISALNPYGRLDFAIQEGVLESQYLTALSSHMSYWQDQDANTFMLKELYKYH